MNAYGFWLLVFGVLAALDAAMGSQYNDRNLFFARRRAQANNAAYCENICDHNYEYNIESKCTVSHVNFKATGN